MIDYVPFDSDTIGNPTPDLGDVLRFFGGHADESRISAITLPSPTQWMFLWMPCGDIAAGIVWTVSGPSLQREMLLPAATIPAISRAAMEGGLSDDTRTVQG